MKDFLLSSRGKVNLKTALPSWRYSILKEIMYIFFLPVPKGYYKSVFDTKSITVFSLQDFSFIFYLLKLLFINFFCLLLINLMYLMYLSIFKEGENNEEPMVKVTEVEILPTIDFCKYNNNYLFIYQHIIDVKKICGF